MQWAGLGHSLIAVVLRATILGAALALSGCSLFEVRQTTEPSTTTHVLPLPPPDPEALLELAKIKNAEGNLGGAVATLEEAASLYPDDKSIQQALAETKSSWQTLRLELEDQLLLARVESLQQTIPLQSKLLQANPDDLALKERLKQQESQLLYSAESLAECGWRHASQRPSLATRCLSLSIEIHENPDVHILLEEIKSRQKKVRDSRQQRSQKKRRKSQLQEARNLADEGDLHKAIDVLDQLLVKQPDDPDAQALAAKLYAQLEETTGRLLLAGDSLYRAGRVEDAMSVWQRSLALNPHDEQAKQKLERGQRVLDNLEKLRKAQKAAAK